ncbi:hypothetical protein CRE_23499 [Caenorhabditis remanei]|uniref:Uncharacterized protein n=1 Tax=Caenorhabditis remanei TaxID=31234 RepID=E3MH11_CAERE|nr:hypothetical protein CRE_23499 [Caenorhabditis remanei]
MGYAPNDRIELLEKETEIKNKSLIIAEWFGTIYLIYTVTLLLVLPAAVIVDIKLRPEYDGDDLYEVIEGSEGSSTKKTDD